MPRRHKGRAGARTHRWLLPTVGVLVLVAGITVAVLAGLGRRQEPMAQQADTADAPAVESMVVLKTNAQREAAPPLLLMDDAAPQGEATYDAASAAVQAPATQAPAEQIAAEQTSGSLSQAAMITRPPDSRLADGATTVAATDARPSAVWTPAPFGAAQPVSTSILSTTGETSAPLQATLRYAKALAGGASLRAFASDTAGVLAAAAPDEPLLITGEEQDAAGVRWYRVTRGTEQGFVRTDEVVSITAEAFGALSAPNAQ